MKLRDTLREARSVAAHVQAPGGFQVLADTVVRRLDEALAMLPALGSDLLCPDCAQQFCPHAEPMHFDKDGCPSCDDENADLDLALGALNAAPVWYQDCKLLGHQTTLSETNTRHVWHYSCHDCQISRTSQVPHGAA